jgi:hypothetical protein
MARGWHGNSFGLASSKKCLAKLIKCRDFDGCQENS